MKMDLEDHFIVVTKHYGYYEYQIEVNGVIGYPVLNIRNIPQHRIVACIKDVDSAIHECRYLEKLNRSKFEKENKK